MADQNPWGSDTPVSLPEPIRREDRVHVDMGGFAFGEFGILHNFREADREAYLPDFAPRTVER